MNSCLKTLTKNQTLDWTNFAIFSLKLKRERKLGKCKNCRQQFFWIDLCEKLERVAHTEVRTKEQSKCRTEKRHSSFVTKIDTNYKITMRSKSTFNIVWPHWMSISVLLNQRFCILKNGCWLKPFFTLLQLQYVYDEKSDEK
jgi:hypothetical protein